MIGLPDKAMVLAMAMARCWRDATRCCVSKKRSCTACRFRPDDDVGLRWQLSAYHRQQ